MNLQMTFFFGIFITPFCIWESRAGSIPVQFDRDGSPFIMGEIDQIALSSFGRIKNVLHLGDRTRLFTSRGIYTNFFQRFFEVTRSPTLQLQNNRSVELRSHAITDEATVVEEKQFLALGTGSDMRSTFSEISFVRNNDGTGSLFFGSSTDRFVSSHCLPDSLIEFSRGYSRYTYSIGRAYPLSEEPVAFRFGAIDKILLIPRRIFTALFVQFPELVNGGTTLGQCAANRNRLPAIRFTIQPQYGPGKMIILRPEDYTRFKIVEDPHNTPMDECDILIGQTPPPYPGTVGETLVEMNPLLIPGFNSFISEYYLFLCESIHYL